MVETSRRTLPAGKGSGACEKAASAHMSGWADDVPSAAAKDAQRADLIGPSDGGQKVWGGDRDDPRLFYFRALLDGDRFFGGVGRA
ncbi:MAG: hypothetical protein ACKVS5_00580 [Parvularculaceae bacterium]